jgi:hypothetical protein
MNSLFKNEPPPPQAAGDLIRDIPNRFAYGINSTNASNFTVFVFSECH